MAERSMTRGAHDDQEHDKKEAKAEDEHIPEGEVIYRAIRQDGDHALEESSASLGWSGLAAGLSMGFSLAGEGLLKAHLPEAVWTPLVSKFGYALGFLMVILGRQQLFTEQTLTAMLPLFSARRAPGIGANVARLWIIVLVANLAGAAAFAAAAAWTPAFSPEVQAAFLHIGQDALAPSWGATFIRGIYAGFLIATMVWLLPGAGIPALDRHHPRLHRRRRRSRACHRQDGRMSVRGVQGRGDAQRLHGRLPRAVTARQQHRRCRAGSVAGSRAARARGLTRPIAGYRDTPQYPSRPDRSRSAPASRSSDRSAADAGSI